MDTSGAVAPAAQSDAGSQPSGRALPPPGTRPLPWLLAWAPVATAGVVAALDVMGLGQPVGFLAVIAALLLLGLTMFAGIRELHAAEERTNEALGRAEAAEAAEHARAEELTEQLEETQRMQRQMVQASKMAAVGELAAAVAHEVNNPLTGVLGFSELLLASLPASDPKRADIAVIHSEAVRARSIVRALLEFARPRPPQRIPTEPNAVVRSAVDLVRFRAQERRVTIVERYGDVPSLEIDPDAMKQVLLNLFSNAFQAMPNGGELRVATVKSGRQVGLRVADNGTGMDATTRDSIFRPFFTTRAGSEGGTGLGLSVGLGIVEGHGGTIEVESEAGVGSTFTIWLPISKRAFKGPVIVPVVDASPAPDGSRSRHKGAAA
jgi:signal transduction histidine kinase